MNVYERKIKGTVADRCFVFDKTGEIMYERHKCIKEQPDDN